MSTIQTIKGKRGNTYRVEMMRNGSRVSKSFKKKSEAQLFAAKLLTDTEFSAFHTHKSLNTLAFCEAVSLYLKQDTGKDTSKHQRLNYWCSVFGCLPAGKVTRQKVKNELKVLAKSKKPATVNRYKAALGALYRFLGDELDTDYNPVKGIPQVTENNARTRFLSGNELPRLLKASARSKWDRLHLLILMAITTGARRSELLHLDWQAINFKKRTAHLGTTKNGQQRILTLTTEVVSELMKFRKTSGFVFPHPSNEFSRFKNFDFYWRKALSEAEISDFRFHDLRHSCASLLAMNGASLLEIAEVLGHKSITMTQRYSHLCISHKASLTDRVFGNINQA